jgi:hypothetical protein
MTPERLSRESSISAGMCSHLIYEVMILEITNVYCKVKNFPNLELSLTS